MSMDETLLRQPYQRQTSLRSNNHHEYGRNTTASTIPTPNILFWVMLQVFVETGPPLRVDSLGPCVKCLNQGHNDASLVQESNQESVTFRLLARRSTNGAMNSNNSVIS